VKVALATAAHLPVLDEDGPELLAALAAEGLDVDVQVWDDPVVDWSGYDLVVLRTVWDYWDKHDAFLAWTRSVPRLLNAPSVIEWNTDKAYLGRLADAGVPVVPTTYLTVLDGWDPPPYRFVVKPSVSAGARDTAAYDGGDPAAVVQVAELLERGKVVMVQPYLDAVDTDGETALLVFDGEVSHAVRKGALLTPGGGVGAPDDYREHIVAREPSPEEVALAQQVLAVAREWGADLLYARIDMLPGPVLIELEVTEPSLFLRHSPGAAQRFARAVRQRAEAASDR
jgi:glutathione synthase/RimK-type ligase-like ATP-grasp enzyme